MCRCGGAAAPACARPAGPAWLRVRVISYTPDPIEPAGDGETFVCCAQPVTELVLDL